MKYDGEFNGGGSVISSASAIFFDLDGTLVDPREGILRSYKYMFEKLGRPCPADSKLESFIGPPIRSALRTLYPGDEAVIEEGVRAYRERYTEVGVFENRIYTGVRELVAALHSSGKRLFVATVKPTVLALKVLSSLELDLYFDEISGAELDGSRDDKAVILADLLCAGKVDSQDSVMVGDRAADIIAARSNSIYAIGVTWGYGREGELDNADAIVNSPAGLQELLLPERPFTE